MDVLFSSNALLLSCARHLLACSLLRSYSPIIHEQCTATIDESAQLFNTTHNVFYIPVNSQLFALTLTT